MSGSDLHMSAVSPTGSVLIPPTAPIEAWGVPDTPIDGQSPRYNFPATVAKDRQPEYQQKHLGMNDRTDYHNPSRMAHTEWHHREGRPSQTEWHHKKDASSWEPLPQQSPPSYFDSMQHSSLAPNNVMNTQSLYGQQVHPAAQGYPPSLSQSPSGQRTEMLSSPVGGQGM